MSQDAGWIIGNDTNRSRMGGRKLVVLAWIGASLWIILVGAYVFLEWNAVRDEHIAWAAIVAVMAMPIAILAQLIGYYQRLREIKNRRSPE